MNGLEERLEALSPEKRLLLDLLRKEKGGASRPAASEPPEDRGSFSLVTPEDRARLPEGLEDAYPLASMQLGMLYHMQLTLDRAIPAYHNLFHFDLSFPVHAGTLREALENVIGRHPILRTAFDLTGFSQPLQLVYRDVRVTLPVIDLSGLAPEDREAEALRFARLESRRVLDLSSPPLLRFFLTRFEPGRERLTMTELHAVAEGWGTYQTLGEIADRYHGLRSGEPLPPAPRPAVSYREFIRLEQEALRSPETREFWREKLRGVTATRVARRPEHLKPATGRGVRNHPFPLPRPMVDGLRALVRRLELPMKSVLLAAHLKVLSLLSGQRDVVTGLHVHGRPETTDGENVRGVFNNTVPLRVDLSPGSWSDLVRRAFDAELELMPHRRFPLAALQREWGREELLEARLGYIHFHLFDQHEPMKDVRIPQGGGERSLSYGTLSLFFWAFGRGPDNLYLWIEADDEQFTDAQVEGFREQYWRVLSAMIRDPSAAHDAEVLPPPQRHAQLVEWNDTAVAPRGDLIHRRFEKCVQEAPDATAVVFEGEALSYGELDRRANRLAHHLRRRGVGPEHRVGVAVERSLEMVVGLLGVLKAGAAYVPLDPDYPRDRLAFMLEDSGARVVLTLGRLADSVPDEGLEVIRLDTDRARVLDQADEPDTPLPDDPDLDGVSYVIYTSGSTGRPKGVMSVHRGTSNLLQWMESAYGFGPRDTMLQTAAFSFDASVWQILLPLVTGGRLLLPRSGGQRDPVYLKRLVERGGVTMLNLTPSLVPGFVDQPDVARAYRGIRFVVCAGEAFPEDHAARLAATLAGRVINHYGPTEASVDSTSQRYLPDHHRGATVPIGRPAHNVRLRVMDPRLRPLPAGVPGELLIGGGGLARGYLARPGLTAERFIPDPSPGHPGDRLYRTGDLVRHLPDGAIEFLGRLDHQVKLRGFRIELGEIESALVRHPSVAEAVAMVRRDPSGNPRLVAYLVAKGEVPTVSVLREALTTHVPEYMIPAAFEILDSLPLTPNGKVDRSALPEPGQERPRLEETFVAPRNRLESLMAEVWADVLKIERVGVNDDFFELGGDSLLATQLFGRLRQRLGTDVSLRAIFDAPTISRLAAVIESRGEVPGSPAREAVAGAVRSAAEVAGGPPIVPVPRDGDLPLSFAQQRLWFLHQMEPESTAYNIYAALRLPGRFVHTRFEAALSELRRRHEVLRTTFRSEGARPVQVVAPPSLERLPLADLGGLRPDDRESELRRLALAEARRPFDLREGPLLRARAVRVAPDDHSLLATMHHSVTDLWSRQIFVREVATLYAAFGAGEPSPLPEMPVQYADYSHWQRSHFAGEVLEGEIDHWRRRLEGAPRLLELPLDRPRPSVQTYRGGGVDFRLDIGLTEALGELGRRHGATLFMTLLAGFFGVLHRVTGQRDLVVGTPVAGRDRPEVEGLIGCFINTLALRTDTAGDPGFLDLLERVRDTALDAYTHQDLPFEKLVEHMELERSVAYSPIFQVMFGLYNLPRATEAAPSGDDSLAFVPLAVDSPVAKFDLEIQMAEAARGLAGSVVYNRDLFDTTTVRRLVDRFEALLAAAVEAPERPVDELPLLAPAERHQVTHEWNDTVAALPADRPLHRWIEEQAERTPDAVAVVFESAALSYGELLRRSATVARRLGELGVGPDSVVGICVDRSLDLLVGLLGILEAGGAYLPLDAALPPERLRLMAEDAGLDVVLADPAVRATLEAGEDGSRARLVPVSGDGSPDAPASEALEVSGHGLAYVIYTSGSTGRPKGVMSSHGGIVNRLLWMQRAFGLGPDDGVLQKTVFTFDVSVWELFWPLMVGARLVVARPGAHWDSSYLAEVVCRERITTMHFVPSMLDLFLEEPAAGGCASLNRVVCSGEALPREIVERFHRRLGAGLYNLYGPTEAAVDVTWWACRRGSQGAGVPIGRPVANTAIHLVDRRFRPVPAGVAGELLIGGVQLARGYLGRPALTAERFVPDPFGAEPGGRVYRTGDLARQAHGGEIEFLGRFDHQVKVRGLRIELGEIESALAEHPAVRQAVVTVRGGGARLGRRRLVAYVVPAEEAADTGELQAHLRERLPDYMVPAVFVELPELPATPSGKVDRKALPEPDRSRHEGAEEFAPPRTGIERTIAAIWQDVLGLDRVGLHDNFFDLGGHSLLVLEAHHRLAAELDQRIPLTTYFQYPTLASLAEFLSRGEDTRFLEERQERAAGRKGAMAQRRAARLARRPVGDDVPPERDTV